MSDIFADREKGFERKYEFDQQQQFKVLARRDKLFGRWVAGKLAYGVTEAEAYAISVVDSNFEHPGDDNLLDKVQKDLSAANIVVNNRELVKKLADCQREAARQIATGE